MYAIIETGGKQYRVQQGSKLRIESVPVEKGQEFQLEKVLLVQGDGGLQIGKPLVSNVPVTAQVLTHDRGSKILVFKKRSKKTYKKTIGHRQNYTEILIKSIGAAAEEPAKEIRKSKTTQAAA